MAAAELSAPASGERPGPELARAVAACYLALWAITLAVALGTALCAAASARSLLGLRLDAAPAPSLGRAAALAAHNLPIAAWPLLLSTLTVHERARSRALTDALVLGCAAANTLPVALALGAYRAALVPFVPQLPLEWGALAVGYGTWFSHRKRVPSRGRRVALLALTAALSCAAAAVETYAVPHAGPSRLNDHGRAGPISGRSPCRASLAAEVRVICINRSRGTTFVQVTVDKGDKRAWMFESHTPRTRRHRRLNRTA